MANKSGPPPSAPDDGDDPFCLDFTKMAAKAKPAAAPPPPAASPKAAAPAPAAPAPKAPPPKAAAPAPAAASKAIPPSPSPSVAQPLRSARPANKPPLPPEAIAKVAPLAPKAAAPAAKPTPAVKPAPAPAAPPAAEKPAPAIELEPLDFSYDPEAAPAPKVEAAPPKAPAPAPEPKAEAEAEAAAPKAPLNKLRQKLAARQAEQENKAPATPAPKPAAAPPPEKSAAMAMGPVESSPPEALGLLDFVAPEPVAAAAMPAPSSFETPSPVFLLDDSEPLFKSDDLGEPLKPPPEKSAGDQLLEEVALLHAAGSSPDALNKLEAALRAGTLGNATEQGWGVLFDLLQVLNRRQAFETLADAYAKRFEKSAPAWLDADASEDITETGGAAQVALSGTLSAASESALKKLVEISQKNPTVHLNLVKVTDADNDGCRLLLDTIRVFKKNKRECLIVGAEEFVALLAGKIEMMQREREETWLLLLELSQQAGKQEYFEDIAVGYAVTFEVSPPSWESVAAGKKAGGVTPTKVAKDPMVLEGELLIGMGAIAALASAAKGKDAITIEIDRLQRIDAASAHALLTELTPLAAHGMHIRIRGVSMLIATLFHIVGIDQIATIEIRRR